jgi:hypothetical protein
MVYIKLIWNWILTPYTYVRQELKFIKRLKELKKKDPFIYK